MKTGPKKIIKHELGKWIDKTGESNVAKICKVHRFSVDNWRRGLVLPHDKMKLRIMKASLGKITPTKMVVQFFDGKQKKLQKEFR